MFNQDPEHWTPQDGLLFAMSMSLFGALINWMTRMRAIRARPTWKFVAEALLEFFYDMIMGSFVGVLTLLVMYNAGRFSYIEMAIACGGVGHAGPALLIKIRKMDLLNGLSPAMMIRLVWLLFLFFRKRKK